MGLSPEGRVVGLAGTNFMLKGLPQALAMLTHLPEETRLAVAGGRNPSRFQAMARNLGVEDRVHFLGRVRRMPTFYHACEAFVLPTLYDACSNVVLEALACGLPALYRNGGGSSELVGFGGLAFEGAEEFMDNLERMVQGYEMFQSCVTIKGMDEIAARYIDLAREILDHQLEPRGDACL